MASDMIFGANLNTILVYTLLQQGILEPVFDGDLAYKFKRIVGKPDFSVSSSNVITRGPSGR